MFYEVPSIIELKDFELASRSGSFIWGFKDFGWSIVFSPILQGSCYMCLWGRRACLRCLCPILLVFLGKRVLAMSLFSEASNMGLMRRVTCLFFGWGPVLRGGFGMRHNALTSISEAFRWGLWGSRHCFKADSIFYEPSLYEYWPMLFRMCYLLVVLSEI